MTVLFLFHSDTAYFLAKIFDITVPKNILIADGSGMEASLSQSGIYRVEFKVQDDDGVSAVSQMVTITDLDAPPM